MGYALSARGIFALAQKCRMYQSRSTFPQGAALGYGQHLGLQPAPTIYWAFVQICSIKCNLFQVKTNPSLVTGLRCKPYTRNLFDYRRLCELVLGWRVFRGNNCVTRARGNDQMLVEVVVDFFAGIQFVRWRYRWGRVFLFLDLIYSLIIPQGYFALRYTILERIVQ